MTYNTMKKINTLRTNTYGAGLVVYNPSGNMFASSGLLPGSVTIWDPNDGRILHHFTSINEIISAIDFSPDGSTFVTGGNQTGICIRNTQNWEISRVLPGHQGRIFHIAFSPDGHVIASSSYADEAIRLWDLDSAQQSVLSPLGRFAFVPKSSTIAVHRDNKISFYNYHTGTLLNEKRLDCAEAVKFSFHPDGSMLAIESEDGRIKIWETKEMTLRNKLSYRLETGRSPVFSPNGKVIAVTYIESSSIVLWDSDTGLQVDTGMGSSDTSDSICFSPDGTKLICSGGGRLGGVIDIWQLE